MSKSVLTSLGKIILFIALILFLSFLVVIISPVKYYIYIIFGIAILINIILYKKMKYKFIEVRIIGTIVFILLSVIVCIFLYCKLFTFIVNKIEISNTVITQEQLKNDSVKVTLDILSNTKGIFEGCKIYYNTGFFEEMDLDFGYVIDKIYNGIPNSKVYLMPRRN